MTERRANDDALATIGSARHADDRVECRAQHEYRVFLVVLAAVVSLYCLFALFRGSYELVGVWDAREHFARVVSHPDGVFELRTQFTVRGHHRPPVLERSRSRRSLDAIGSIVKNIPGRSGVPGRVARPVPNGRRLMKLQSDAVRRVVVHHGVPRLLEVFPYRRRDVPT